MKNTKFTLNCTLAMFFCIALLCSCGSSYGTGGGLWAAGAQDRVNFDHKGKMDLIEKNYQNCLASAQNAIDSTMCDAKYDEDLENENDRYNEAINAINEKQNFAKYQKFVLNNWGYSEKESNKVVKRLLAMKGDDYSFDADEAISELIKDGYKDNVAILKLEKELPDYGVSKDKAEQVVKEYYEDEYYTCDGRFKEPYSYLIGNEVYCNRQMLIKMGLIDDEDNWNEDGDNNNDDEEIETPNHLNLNNPNTSDPDIVNNDFQVEANAISSLVISQYRLNGSTLSSEQKNELERVISFMKKWPNAKITIIGHACSLGTNAINNTIGLKRAQQAKLYLVKQGINENRIEEISKGATEPCANNNNETGRLQNRRITFLVK